MHSKCWHVPHIKVTNSLAVAKVTRLATPISIAPLTAAGQYQVALFVSAEVHHKFRGADMYGLPMGRLIVCRLNLL